ncbi:Vacuolar protein-sorting-associated protein 25 [Candida parapsilosis]|nr:Vacuolar protein-sorting-associated protein 25 [Candida parapsilosis]KAI5908404.1 Vacuolar protein-sorting-associated protein 25 [Candida parapsilosis]CAD1809373.1 unnamed protein product [Candida parapsilosis]
MTTQQHFEFPKIHSFPPLYTKQPNQTVQQQQIESWCNILLQYCEFYKITSLTIEGAPKHSQLATTATTTTTTTSSSSSSSSYSKANIPPLFVNKSINRQVNSEFKNAIINNLIHSKRGQYINHKKPELGIFVYWRSIVDWGNLLYEYIVNTGQQGSVLTLYELTKSDFDDVEEEEEKEEEGVGSGAGTSAGLPRELRNLDEEFLVKIIKDYLIKQGKAQLLMTESNEIGGVKIV